MSSSDKLVLPIKGKIKLLILLEGKTLFTNQEDGELITLDCFRNVKDEAIDISSSIEKLKKKYSLNEIAILVRAIFQTREFEERFLKIGIPYRILGGIKFYERAEIKDCVAYLRLIYQEKDDQIGRASCRERV